jgi:hypothetical protein
VLIDTPLVYLPDLNRTFGRVELLKGRSKKRSFPFRQWIYSQLQESPQGWPAGVYCGGLGKRGAPTRVTGDTSSRGEIQRKRRGVVADFSTKYEVDDEIEGRRRRQGDEAGGIEYFSSLYTESITVSTSASTSCTASEHPFNGVGRRESFLFS